MSAERKFDALLVSCQMLPIRADIDGELHISSAPLASIPALELLHLQPQQAGFWTARRGPQVPVSLVEGAAALVEGLDGGFAFALVVAIPTQTVFSHDAQLGGR